MPSYGHKSSTVISARLTHEQVAAFVALARERGESPGVFLRGLIELAANPAMDPAETLAAIAKMLGLDPATPPSGVIDALRTLFDQLPSESPAGTTPAFDDGAAPPAPRPGTEAAALSKTERDYCAKFGLSPEAFALKKARAARTIQGRSRALKSNQRK
jgi:hypothetical protein